MSNKQQSANKIQYDEFINRMNSSKAISEPVEDGSYAVFDKFFRKVPLPSVLIDMADGTLIDLNHEYQAEFGITKDEAIGKTPIELSLWESLELSQSGDAAFPDKSPKNYLKIKSKSGIFHTYSMHTEILNLDGKKCLLCILENDRLPDRLANITGNLTAISDVSNHGICIIQHDRLLYANEKFAELTALSLEKIYESSPEEIIAEIVHPDYKQIVLSTYTEFKPGAIPRSSMEFKILHPERGERWLELNAKTLELQGEPAILTVMVDITDRKRIYEQLKIKERLFTTLMDSVEDSIFIKNDKLEYIHVNTRMEELSEMKADELIGKTDEDLFDEETAAHIIDADKSVLKGEIFEGEYTKVVNGAEHIFHIIKSPIRDLSGEITGLCGIARDITERKKIELEIKKSEQRFRTIIENTKDIVCSYTPEGIITYVSPHSLRRYGYNPEEVIGHRILEFIHPDDYEIVVSDLQRTLHTGEEFATEFRLLGKDGTYYYVEERSSVIREGDKIVQLSGVIRDYTERKQAREALEESEFKYRSLVETMSEGLGAIDSNGDITFVNNSICKMLGYSQSELVGRPFMDFLGEEFKELLEKQIAMRKTGKRSSYEISLMSKGGEKVDVLLSSVPVFNSSGDYSGSFAVITDITERKLIESELYHAHSELEQIFQAATPMIVIGLDHTILKVNDTYKNLYEINNDDTVGKKCFEVYSGIKCDTEECPIKRILAGEEKYEYEDEDVSALENGEKIHTLALAIPYRDANDEIIGIVASYTDITRLKEAEEALKESESRFRDLAELAPEAIYEMDKNGFLTFANRVAFEMFGYKKEEMNKGLSAISIISPYQKEKAYRNMRRIFANEDIGANDYEVIRKDGSTFNVTMHSAPIVKDGEVVGARGVIVDITDRKRTEEALRASELFNRAVIDKSPLGVSVRSKTGKFIRCNEAWKKIWGRSDKDIEGYLKAPERDRLTFTQTDDYLKKRHREIRQIYEKGGYLYIPELKLTKRDAGGNKWVSQHFYALKDSDGNVDKVVILTEDITERKQAIEALKQSEIYYRGLYESAHDAIIVLDPGAEAVLDVNQKACEIYGYKRSELVGKLMKDISKDLNTCRKHLERVLNQESFYSFETVQLRKDKSEMILEINASRVMYKGQVAILSVNRDITDKRKAEIALRENEEKYRLLVENAGQPIFSVDYNGQFVAMNNTAAKYLGGRPEEFSGKNMQDLFPKDIARRQISNIRKAIKTGRKVVTESPTIFHNQERWFITNIQPIKGPGNEIPSALLVANDITPRKRLEIREKAKSQFLDGLRKVKNINQALELCCKTIQKAKIFKRGIITFQDSDNKVLNCGQVGVDKAPFKKLVKCSALDEDLIKKLTRAKLKLSHSYYIPADSPMIAEIMAKCNFASEKKVAEDGLILGDILYVPLVDDMDKPEAWLLADKPLAGHKPELDDVIFVEELVDVTGKKVREIRYLELLENERAALQEKNITLREVLTYIEEEKMEIKNKIASEVQNSLMPLVKKLVKPDGNINQTCYNILSQGLDSLVAPAGAQQIYSKLSPREIEICNMIKTGATSKDIGRELNISLATVQKHRESTRKKLKITNKSINLMTFLKGQ